MNLSYSKYYMEEEEYYRQISNWQIGCWRWNVLSIGYILNVICEPGVEMFVYFYFFS